MSFSDDSQSNGPYDITELTKHCILHAAMVLAPRGVKLPSGTHRIEQFCEDILNYIQIFKKTKKKKQVHLPESSLVPQVEILNFYEGVSSFQDFATVVCDSITKLVDEGFDETKIHQLCWEHYSEYFKADIAYPKWLTSDDTFRLWLIFCSHLSWLSTNLDSDIMNDILRRFVSKASVTWNESFLCTEQIQLDFPTFLAILTKCFATLQVDTCVVAEIIDDIKDEIINGVLRKGYLFKKGHRVHNWKRRFFVLTRDSLRYYDTREKLNEKGTLAINEQTQIETVGDRGERKNKFSVTCGKTGVVYIMSADDKRTRNEWMLDIGKAIQLEQALQKDSDLEFSNSIAGFYQLKYGTSTPNLKRLDSTVRHATFTSNPQTKVRLKKLSGNADSLPSPTTTEDVSPHRSLPPNILLQAVIPEADLPDQDVEEDSTVNENCDDLFYQNMTGPGQSVEKVPEGNESDDEDGGYTFMFQGRGTDIKKALEGEAKAISKKRLHISLSSPSNVSMEVNKEIEETTENRQIDDRNLYEEYSSDTESLVHSSEKEHELLASSGSHLESISELMKVSLSKQHPHTLKDNDDAILQDTYIKILPDGLPGSKGSDTDNSPPIPPQRISLTPQRTKFGFDTTTSLSPTAVVSPPVPLDSQGHESSGRDDIYYIVPPPVPSHRTRGGTP